uniref:NADH-ubiquinone oxidoreductase chain 4 n=1 Tax=Anthicidae sp. 1 ACP-2013 TaxID=1434426 RepID=A0A3G5FNG8_9CUCU|nr:NADH dehydrogenase subunit 4 [Anthicidae sp. 1 ACP-2013]
MMKFLMVIFMLIPLGFFNYYWLVQFSLLFLSFLFLVTYSFSSIYMYISMGLGMDLLSFTLILLSLWICSLMIMASQKIYLKNSWSSLFILVNLILLLSLYLTFSSMSMFMFYIFFEVSLIPTLMLIVGWGYQPERLQAGFYLLFYTLFASLPMMISIFYYYSISGTLEFYFLDVEVDELLVYICMNLVFFIKIPMFFVHLWLPKAHVEAPVSGSMILAGIMLKLGGYGLMRVLVIFVSLGLTINLYFISLSLIGGFFVSLICIRQSDIKSLIAYSSVAHMGLALSGILTLNYWGMVGALMMMIAHGLCSSGLFCLANIGYERILSRSLYLNKGMINILPSLSLWWFMFVSSNMAAPPSLNLAGEIMLINSVLAYDSFNILVLSLLSFFSAVYSLYLYSFSQHGMIYSGLYSFYSGSVREYLLLMLHWLPLNLLILKGELVCSWL